jgi:hypothetical protein
MRCSEHFSLLTNYQNAVTTYAESVRRLREHGRDIPDAEFMLLWKFAYRAQQNCQEARHQLHRHLIEHECLVKDPNPAVHR